jgi:hypothetical protein
MPFRADIDMRICAYAEVVYSGAVRLLPVQHYPARESTITPRRRVIIIVLRTYSLHAGWSQVRDWGKPTEQFSRSTYRTYKNMERTAKTSRIGRVVSLMLFFRLMSYWARQKPVR